MDNLEEAKQYIRFLYSQVQDCARYDNLLPMTIAPRKASAPSACPERHMTTFELTSCLLRIGYVKVKLMYRHSPESTFSYISHPLRIPKWAARVCLLYAKGMPKHSDVLIEENIIMNYRANERRVKCTLTLPSAADSAC